MTVVDNEDLEKCQLADQVREAVNIRDRDRQAGR